MKARDDGVLSHQYFLLTVVSPLFSLLLSSLVSPRHMDDINRGHIEV